MGIIKFIYLFNFSNFRVFFWVVNNCILLGLIEVVDKFWWIVVINLRYELVVFLFFLRMMLFFDLIVKVEIWIIVFGWVLKIILIIFRG